MLPFGGPLTSPAMIRPILKRRKSLSQPRRLSASIERLEPRWTMDGTAVSAAAGLPWLDPDRLTYSFALDGTQLGTEHSNLFAEMRYAGSQVEWQQAFHSAFMEWLEPLGKSIEIATDSGMPFGSPGSTQHDLRFGDVRIAAIPLSENVMAESIPNNLLTQGSWAGDIILNSNAQWSDLHQVFSVAMHEFGHVLGLGHSTDPASPMYFHGVASALHPTAADIAQLEKIYAGVHIDAHEGTETSEHPPGPWEDEPQFPFDVTQAVPLHATIGATAQFSASGELTSDVSRQTYELVATGAIDHYQNLNIAVFASNDNGLMPQLTVYDEAGDKMSTTVLHSAGGVLTIQVKDAEPQFTYYVAVTAAAAPAENQVGGFNLFASYTTAALATKSIGTFNLSSAWPIAEQSIEVSTSRLIHLHAQATSTVRNVQTAIWFTLVDANDQIVAQLAMPVGTSRSAPLFFVAPGQYRLIMQAGNQDGSAIKPIALKVSIDEVSIDVGAGVIDTTLNPNLDCSMPGNDPNTCQPSPPITLVDPVVYPDPATLPPVPEYPSIPPWNDPTWLYWPDVSTTFPLHNFLMPLDVSGDSLTTPIDALQVITAINSNTRPAAPIAAGFVDVNHDGRLTPLDALLVINYLNRRAVGEAEGVSEQTPIVSASLGVAVDWSIEELSCEQRRPGRPR